MARTKNLQNLIAVDSDSEEHGVLTGWGLHGPVKYAVLTEAFIAAGLDPKLVKDAPTPEAVLGRIIGGLSSKGIDRRKLPGGGWAIVDVTFGADNLPRYAEVPRIVATLNGKELVLAYQGKDADADRIRAEFTTGLTELDTVDCSGWFVSLMRKHDGVTVLRDNGGTYFIPPTHVASWRKFTAVIEGASHHSFGEIPAMMSDRAIQTVLRGLAADVKSEGEKLQAQLLKVLAGEKTAIKPATIADREKDVALLLTKISRYEALFGKPAEEASNICSKLKANILTTMRYAVGKASGRDMDAPRLLDLDDKPETVVYTAQVSTGAVDRFNSIGEEVRKDIAADTAPRCGKLTPEYDGTLFPVKPCLMTVGHAGGHCPRI